MTAPRTRRRLAWRLVLAALLPSLAPLAAGAAAGIDCDLAMSESEQAICADPVLRGMDADLAAAWTRARADRARGDALVADQQRWLRERDACGAEVACLRPIYARRIAELSDSAAPFRWTGAWTRLASNGEGGELRIDARAAGHYHVAMDASAGANMGSLEADAGPGQDRLALAAIDGAPRCRIVLHRVGGAIEVEQNEDSCGAGLGVMFSGRYVRGDAARAPVHWDLLTLGVIARPGDDARLRALLGAKDYDAVVAAADQIQDADNPDPARPPGARVKQLAVRGLYTLQEALVMQAPEGRLWVALLDVDAQRRPQLRYWTTEADWTDRLPPAIDAWRARFAEVPVRMMSSAGQPAGRGPGAPPAAHD